MLDNSLCKKYFHKLIIVYILNNDNTIWQTWSILHLTTMFIQPPKLREISRTWYFC